MTDSDDGALRRYGWFLRAWDAHWRDLVVVALYLALAVFAYIRVWTAPGPAAVAPDASDPALSMWYLTYTPFALLHVHNPFYSSWANTPYGVNLMDNTGEQAPGLLAMPVTLLFGPASAYVALLTFALASSATAGYALLRRLTTWRGAAFVGGLLFGFSPYMVGQGEVHLNLVLVPIPPLIILVLHQLFVRRRGRPEVLGLVLAALVVTQYFVSTEVLATTIVVCVLGVVAASALAPHQVRPLIGPAIRCGVIAATVSALVLGYPIWVALDGPARLSGPIQTLPQAYRADLAASIVPSRLQAIAPAAALHASALYVDGGGPENGAYIGIPLILVLLGTTVLLWRRFIVRIAALLFVACFVLSLGARLVVSGSPSPTPSRGLPLPEAIFDHIPLLSNLLPVRFTLFVGLFAGVLLASATDAVWMRTRRSWAAWPTRAAVALSVSVAALIPLVPAWPYTADTLSVPSYFTTRSVDAVPPGSTVLLYPYPGWAVDNSAPMLWQADSFMRFKIAGGYFLVPQQDGQTSVGRTTTTQLVLNAVYNGTAPARTAALRSTLSAELRSWNVSVVIADQNGSAGQRGVSFLAWLVGRPPVLGHGVAAWYRVNWGH